MSNMEVSRDFRGIIPAEIDSEVKITKGITAKTLIVVIGTLMLSQQFVFLVHPSLKLPYLLFCIAASVLMVMPAPRNPEKKMYHCILFSFRKDRNVYHPIDQPEYPMEGTADYE